MSNRASSLVQLHPTIMEAILHDWDHICGSVEPVHTASKWHFTASNPSSTKRNTHQVAVSVQKRHSLLGTVHLWTVELSGLGALELYGPQLRMHQSWAPKTFHAWQEVASGMKSWSGRLLSRLMQMLYSGFQWLLAQRICGVGNLRNMGITRWSPHISCSIMQGHNRIEWIKVLHRMIHGRE